MKRSERCTEGARDARGLPWGRSEPGACSGGRVGQSPFRPAGQKRGPEESAPRQGSSYGDWILASSLWLEARGAKG